MAEYVVKNYLEERRLENQRRELEQMAKSDPNYEADRRQLQQMLASEQARLRREEAQEAAQRAKSEEFQRQMQDPEIGGKIYEDMQRMLEEEEARRQREEWRRIQRDPFKPPDDFKKKFDDSEGDLQPKPRVDPLVLDLDGDGIETTDLSNGAFFDHDGNGLAELSSWVSNDDGLLVMDRNGDTIINDGGELFGDHTLLKNGLKASNGFQALAELDTNGDGKIDARDQAFGRLRVWKDSNGDGYSSPEELHPLEELGIKSINLQSAVVNIIDVQLNTRQRVGTFEKVDGSTGQIADYGFYRETTYTLANEWLAVPLDVSAMPILKGYGNVYDLHQAIARDDSGQLKALVGAFSTATAPSEREALLTQILFRWTGTYDIAPQSRGNNIDARKVAVLEEFFGERWLGQAGSNPDTNAAVLLNEAYRRMFEYNYAQLMIQTHLQDTIGQITWSTQPETGAVQIDEVSVDSMLTNLLTNVIDNPEQGMELLGEFARTMRGLGSRKDTPGYLAIREFFVQQDPDLAWVFDSGGLHVFDQLGQGNGWYYPHMFGTDNADAVKGSLIPEADGWINGLGGNDVIYGTDRDEYLYNGTGDALLVGGGGNDVLYAGDGDDVLDGGAGKDTLYGEAGNDTYIVRRGSGSDTIIDREADQGGPIPQTVLIFREAVRPRIAVWRRHEERIGEAFWNDSDRCTFLCSGSWCLLSADSCIE
jgi:hypothetical protein